MTRVEITDVALVRAIAQADQMALSQLYDRYARVLYSLGFKMLGSAEEAEELVVDVFSQVWRNVSSYCEERGRVDTWLFTMTRSRALDRLRKRKRQSKIMDASVQEASIDHVDSPQDQLLIQERRNQVENALKQLPDEQRNVIELAYFGGLSKSEIAAQTGVSVGTVKTRTRLGLNKLRGLLV